MPDASPPTRVSILATPDSTATPITGFFETLGGVGPLTAPEDRPRRDGKPFEVEIVAERAGPLNSASGIAITAHRAVDEVDRTDLVIIPSMTIGREVDWATGRYPKLVHWLREMYDGGATICAACTGANLAAETGLLDGNQATVHWIVEHEFRHRYPDVDVRIDEVLVVSGEGDRLVTSGAATAWHDMALYIIARYVGPATAQSVARFLLFEWHRDGQQAFHVFNPPTGHGDAAVLAAQRAIAENFAVATPVEEMVRWSGLAPRTFKRRFTAATDHTPIAYVQRVRIEHAKRLLETSDQPIEEISWAVGYEDPASFRRLFKRLTGMAPGAYRQRFQVPVVSLAR
ncbi:MAG TPA: helix-turn-helix domain-containing protein [Solirubrobacteraceae bacterium]